MAGEDFGDFGSDLGSFASALNPRPSFNIPDFSGVEYDVQPLTPTGGATGGGGGLGDFLAKLGGGLRDEFTRSPLKSFATSLGVAGAGLGMANQFRAQNQLNRQTRMLEQGQRQAQAAAAPAIAAGTANIERGQAGKLQPSMEASIQQWLQQKKADLRGRYAQMGLGNSTDIQHGEAQLDLMAESMRGQLLQGEESLGAQELQTGSSAAGGVQQGAQGQQQLLAQLIAQADQMLGQLGGQQR